MTFHSDSPDGYLETEVLTATPQKLQLMMINGAIRFAYQAQQLRDQHDPEGAWEKLLRCREIVAVILCNLKPDGEQVVRDVAGIYTFLFQELTDLHAADEYQRLDGVLKVLEEERETWEQICQIMPEAPERPSEREREITSSDAQAYMEQSQGAENNTETPRRDTAFGYDFNADSYGSDGGGISFDA